MAAGSRKVVLVGGMGAGKSCLAVRLARDEFLGRMQPTVGAALHGLILEAGQKIDLWDTAGQERFLALTPMYYRGAAVIMLCFDLHNVQKDLLQRRAADLVSHAEPEAKVLLIGTKADMVDEAAVTAACEPAEAACAAAGLTVFGKALTTSAKTGAGLDALKTQLQALCTPSARPSRAFSLFGGSNDTVRLGDDTAAPSRGCC